MFNIVLNHVIQPFSIYFYININYLQFWNIINLHIFADLFTLLMFILLN